MVDSRYSDVQSESKTANHVGREIVSTGTRIPTFPGIFGQKLRRSNSRIYRRQSEVRPRISFSRIGLGSISCALGLYLNLSGNRFKFLESVQRYWGGEAAIGFKRQSILQKQRNKRCGDYQLLVRLVSSGSGSGNGWLTQSVYRPVTSLATLRR